MADTSPEPASFLSPLLAIIDAPGIFGELLRSLRQGLYFGLETRLPYAVAGILRPMMFGKESRGIQGQLAFFGQQALAHGWIIARISFLFKLLRAALIHVFGKEEEWQTFVSGAIAGYLVMVRDGNDAVLKTQVNMAIGIRTMYAIGSYLVRKGLVPGISDSPQGYHRGSGLYLTIMWGAVMWHWQHQTKAAPGEMMKAQVAQMDFIYKHGDKPGIDKWFGNNYLLWAVLCFAASRLLK